MKIESETAWAACWLTSSPRPFILTSTVSNIRSEVIEKMGSVWKREGETDSQGWRRAYRQGCRAVRVQVSVLNAPALVLGPRHGGKA